MKQGATHIALSEWTMNADVYIPSTNDVGPRCGCLFGLWLHQSRAYSCDDEGWSLDFENLIRVRNLLLKRQSSKNRPTKEQIYTICLVHWTEFFNRLFLITSSPILLNNKYPNIKYNLVFLQQISNTNNCY